MSTAWTSSPPSDDTGSTGPVSATGFPAEFSQTVCRDMGPCCSDNGFTHDYETCRASLDAQLRSLLTAREGMQVRFDEAAAGACVSAYSAALRACEPLHDQACELLFVGLVSPGGACTESVECAEEPGTYTYCESGLCTLDANDIDDTPLAEGDACAATCESYDNGQSCLTAVDAMGTGSCFTNDGLYCEPCTGYDECVEGSRCSDGVCRKYYGQVEKWAATSGRRHGRGGGQGGSRGRGRVESVLHSKRVDGSGAAPTGARRLADSGNYPRGRGGERRDGPHAFGAVRHGARADGRRLGDERQDHPGLSAQRGSRARRAAAVMTRPELNDDFVDMLDALRDGGVEFLVVGAHALAVHGWPRATGDLDLLVRPSPPNAARVVEALRAFGAPVDAHGVKASDFEKTGVVYQIGLPPRRIDLLTSISGVTFDEAWQDRATVTVSGREIFVLGKESLITNKRATGREKDLLDVQALTGEAKSDK